MFSIFVFIISSQAALDAARPPSCDIPISMTFLDAISAPEAIWNDDPFVPYQNGVDGMDIVINCSSRDATLIFASSSSRRAWVQLPEPIPDSIIEQGPPSFAGGQAFLGKIFLNIRNLTGRNSGIKIPGPAAAYYTKAAYQFDGPDGVHYRLGFMPGDSACPAGEICVPNIHGNPFPESVNLPQQSGWVKVSYMPQPDQRDEFLVEGEFTYESDTQIQRAGLFVDGSWIHMGQYSMPFKVLVKALSPIPPFAPSISIGDVNVSEGNSGTQNITFSINLDAAVSNSVSVKYSTANGSAKSPSDYTSKTGTATIPAGATSTTVTFSVKGDTLQEPNETFFINLTNPVNATIIDSQGVCTIVNDD
jgi:hypothetical protein